MNKEYGMRQVRECLATARSMLSNAQDILEQMGVAEFADEADAVAAGKEIPAEEGTAGITLGGKDARRVADLLERIAYFQKSGPWNNEEQAFAKMIVAKLRNKIKGEEEE